MSDVLRHGRWRAAWTLAQNLATNRTGVQGRGHDASIAGPATATVARSLRRWDGVSWHAARRPRIVGQRDEVHSRVVSVSHGVAIGVSLVSADCGWLSC